jgi:hypothetical protein
VRDAAAIRHAAIAEGILCLTSIDTAVAAARSLAPEVQRRVAELRSLQEWVAVPGVAAPGMAGVAGMAEPVA